jgi:hypothetical protein
MQVPPARTVAKDIRWASADSFYLLHWYDGAFEVGLDGKLRRLMVPPNAHLRFSPYDHLAVSDKFLVAASGSRGVAWRPLKTDADRNYRLESRSFSDTDAVDLRGDRILLFGLRENVYNKEVQANGEVAWLGTLSSELKDLKPVYFDRSGPRMPQYCRCKGFGISGVRFLADGSFVIVPGFEKGVYLYSADGRLQRSWTSEEVGLDTDCSRITDEEEEAMLHGKGGSIQSWLNRHHVLDAILPLPQGPGLLVRSRGEDGKFHWDLEILSRSRVDTYRVPLTGSRNADRLRGDVREGKIALLLSSSGVDGLAALEDPKGEIVILEVPN